MFRILMILTLSIVFSNVSSANDEPEFLYLSCWYHDDTQITLLKMDPNLDIVDEPDIQDDSNRLGFESIEGFNSISYVNLGVETIGIHHRSVSYDKKNSSLSIQVTNNRPQLDELYIKEDFLNDDSFKENTYLALVLSLDPESLREIIRERRWGQDIEVTEFSGYSRKIDEYNYDFETARMVARALAGDPRKRMSNGEIERQSPLPLWHRPQLKNGDGTQISCRISPLA